MFPDTRLRRLRNTAVSKMISENFPPPEKLILPFFVVEQQDAKIPISSLPGHFRLGIKHLSKEVEKALKSRIGGIILFPVPDEKNKTIDASYAYSEKNFTTKIIAELNKNFKNHISIWVDLCLCSYTSTGQCGIITKKGYVDNDETLKVLSKIAIQYANAGVDGIAPSAMMDGQVCEIRKSLDKNGFINTLIMSYSSKFASSFYGPFREAADSSPRVSDRKSYQLPPSDLRQAIRESLEDEKEGADILMVKPALPYLDVICELRKNTFLPIAAYNVSGEYSMIRACAQNNWGNLYDMARESLLAIFRAGADIIITYWAAEYEKLKTI
ncbi:MAG TPA: porphobilinogen synthase [Victivallales bacterium]|nr:porphobilinogen synthase [Victivallales bacterium]